MKPCVPLTTVQFLYKGKAHNQDVHYILFHCTGTYYQLISVRHISTPNIQDNKPTAGKEYTLEDTSRRNDQIVGLTKGKEICKVLVLYSLDDKSSSTCAPFKLMLAKDNN